VSDGNRLALLTTIHTGGEARVSLPASRHAAAISPTDVLEG
jgi:hypothetical protein